MTNSNRSSKEPTSEDGVWPPSASAQLKGSFDAMWRAARRAQAIAQQTGTDLILQRAGNVVHVQPSGASDLFGLIARPGENSRSLEEIDAGVTAAVSKRTRRHADSPDV